MQVELDDFGDGHGLPARRAGARRSRPPTASTVHVTTVYDLLMAQYGVDRGLAGDYPADYDDENAPYTPAWSEKYTGIGREDADPLRPRMGPHGRADRRQMHDHHRGRHQPLVSRQPDVPRRHPRADVLRLRRRERRRAGALRRPGKARAGRIVVVDRVRPKDWYPAVAAAERAELALRPYRSVALREGLHRLPHGAAEQRDRTRMAQGHTMDMQVRAVRNGWLPFYPQFPENPLDVVAAAREAGAKTPDEVAAWVAERLKNRELKFSVEDPDAEENWPRVWFIWRGNALMASAKGHEYFLKHYLGTHDNCVGEDMAAGFGEGSRLARACAAGKDGPGRRSELPHGHLGALLGHRPAGGDLVREGRSQLDRHAQLHSSAVAGGAAVLGVEERLADFKAVAKKFSELAAKHFPEPVEDLVAAPLAHDSPAEIAQPTMKHWIDGEVEAIPGKTMPGFKVVTRDYKNVYNQFISFGPLVRAERAGRARHAATRSRMYTTST